MTAAADAKSAAPKSQSQPLLIVLFAAFLAIMASQTAATAGLTGAITQLTQGNVSGALQTLKTDIAKVQAKNGTQSIQGGTVRAKPSILGGPHLPADCRLKLGGERILCAAKLYDGYGYEYGGGHSSTVSIMEGWNGVSTHSIPAGSQVVDCSSEIDEAVFGAYGIAENNLAQTFINSQYWKQIDMAYIRPGDALVKDDYDQHIALVDKILGPSYIRAFDAETAENRPLDQQIQYYNYHTDYFTYALRWVGPGAVK